MPGLENVKPNPPRSSETEPTVDGRGRAETWIGGTPKRLLIDSDWLEAASGETLETVNPATEEVITRIAAADRSDVDRAVSSARRAFAS